MLFNSLQFALFFLIVYSLYLLLNHKGQNRMLLVASYIFYGAWDWRFLFLIIISTVLDYVCGLKIHEFEDIKRRRFFLFLSVFINLAILGFFKYFNFFADSLQSTVSYFGFSIQPRFLNIILPVGISFYTFQTMSYTIDIYRKKLEPTRKFFDFALFVAFFPQLVAGPIERAKRLLPQILAPREVNLDKFYQGCYLIFWGLFQKIYVADNLARIVDPVFLAKPPYNGSVVLIALYAFAFQILCDFAGYSNIARGLGKCMGFDIMINFNLPYFAKNPREFWQRWHISLSTWLRDYLYIPLGGNKNGKFKTYRNLGITMLLGGLWHGASWAFIIWGAYQGALLIAHRVFSSLTKNLKFTLISNIYLLKIWKFIKILFFFNLICLGWLIFRAQSLTQMFHMLHSLFFNFSYNFFTLQKATEVMSFIWLLLVVQMLQYRYNDLMIIFKSKTLVRIVFYYICLLSILLFGVYGAKEFIYFQF